MTEESIPLKVKDFVLIKELVHPLYRDEGVYARIKRVGTETVVVDLPESIADKLGLSVEAIYQTSLVQAVYIENVPEDQLLEFGCTVVRMKSAFG